ncbi:MAG: hypothetical protein WCD86_21745 [Ktedonobacteraceae bacterium]
MTMADSITEPDTNDIDPSHTDERILRNEPDKKDGGTVSLADEQSQMVAQVTEAASTTTVIGDKQHAPIIWTPRFIVTFALIVIVGMSLNSLLAQDWIDGGTNEFWIMAAHVILVLGACIAAIVIARSRWVRLGSIFGCIWAVFTALNLLTGYLHAYHTFDIQASLNALISCSLLGLSICLAIDRTPLRRWDTWFFRLALIAGIGIAVVPFVISLASGLGTTSPIGILESDIAGAAVIISLPIWWLRPSCWKTQPGVTLLFGLVPAFLLYLAIPGAANRATNIFFLETLYLCMFLGILRVIQSELRWRRYIRAKP